MKFTVVDNSVRFISELDSLSRQMAFAESLALNRTAKEARAEVQKTMRRVFDRPTPFSLNAFLIEHATKTKLVATIHQRFSGGWAGARNWLDPQVNGGDRRPKAFENALAAVLGKPKGTMFFVPGPGAKLDAYGNLSGGQLGQILSDMSARMTDAYQNASDASRKRNKRARYFAIKGRGGKVLIVRKESKGLSVALVGTSTSPGYQKRFPFHETVRETALAAFPRHLEAALEKAFRTAR